MGKAFAGLVRLLAVVALAGGVAYNYYEISRLKAEVASLRAGNVSHSPAAKKEFAETPMAKDGGAMADVQRRAERAQEFLRKQDYGAAKRELEAAAAAIRHAGADASDKTARTIDQLRRTVSDLSAKAEEFTGSATRVMNGKKSENAETNGKKSE